MNRLPPQPGPPEDADERYRRASERDPSRPSESVRRAVLAHAAGLSAGCPHRPHPRLWRRPALFGTLAAAAVAGLLVVPRYLTPGSGGEGAVAPAPRTTGAAQVPGAGAPAEMPAPGAPPAPPPPRESYLQVRPRQLAGSARVREPGSPARAPSVASRPEADTADTTPEPKDARTNGAPSSGLGGMPAPPPYSAGLASRAALAAPAPAADSPRSAVLWRAAESGDVGTVQSLMSGQADINARDPQGRTALMLAALHDQAAVVSVLLEHGADPNVPDAHGSTPLAAAAAGGHQAVVEALQRYGAR